MKLSRFGLFFSFIFSLSLFFSSCSIINPLQDGYEQKYSYSDILFKVNVPSSLSTGEELYLELLDEVTGIPLNPSRFKMSLINQSSYSLNLPLAVGTSIRYRYLKIGESTAIEHTVVGQPVRYRLYQVSSNDIVIDTVTSWNENSFSGPSGEISGNIFNSQTDSPLSEIAVFLNGMRTFTAHDGYYKFENVPVGEYNLTAMHIDGLYKTFQQRAVVAENSVTPASFGMKAAKTIKIKFNVKVPEETIPGTPIRMLGNLASLGYTHYDISGGTGIIPSTAPVLTMNENGDYGITLSLPEGYHLRYKFSLGDSFINSEHTQGGEFRTRELIIPDEDIFVNDIIETWFDQQRYALNFEISVPKTTPLNDLVTIQFNPFTWMEPFPIWKSSDSLWKYRLYNPMEFLNQSQYRFCRNEQCGKADDAVTTGENPVGYVLDLGDKKITTIKYDLKEWSGLMDIPYQIKPIPAPETNHILIKSFELDSKFDKHWIPYIQQGLIDAGVSGANWIFFSPSWTFVNEPAHSANFNPEFDPFTMDIQKINNSVMQAGMYFALFPQPNLYPSLETYWTQANLTYTWWQKWMDDYERFIINYADFAESNNISTIYIGGKFILPSYPNGFLPNGNPSNTPLNFPDRWIGLIEKVRSRYHGQLGFALPYSENIKTPPAFLDKFDILYIEMDASLSASNPPSTDEIKDRMGQILDQEIYELYETLGKPIILGLDYYSMDGAASNCANLGDICRRVASNPQSLSTVDTVEQADIYHGIFQASLERSWISGWVSKGYNPAVAVQDQSSSVHGKPAYQVTSYFYHLSP